MLSLIFIIAGLIWPEILAFALLGFIIWHIAFAIYETIERVKFLKKPKALISTFLFHVIPAFLGIILFIWAMP